MACPFTVVVFPYNLKDVGDVRRLEGRNIEIHGAVKLYDGKAEIILNRISQIAGGRDDPRTARKTTTWKNKATTARENATYQEANGYQAHSRQHCDLRQRRGSP